MLITVTHVEFHVPETVLWDLHVLNNFLHITTSLYPFYGRGNRVTEIYSNLPNAMEFRFEIRMPGSVFCTLKEWWDWKKMWSNFKNSFLNLLPSLSWSMEQRLTDDLSETKFTLTLLKNIKGSLGRISWGGWWRYTLVKVFSHLSFPLAFG